MPSQNNGCQNNKAKRNWRLDRTHPLLVRSLARVVAHPPCYHARHGPEGEVPPPPRLDDGQTRLPNKHSKLGPSCSWSAWGAGAPACVRCMTVAVQEARRFGNTHVHDQSPSTTQLMARPSSYRNCSTCHRGRARRPTPAPSLTTRQSQRRLREQGVGLSTAPLEVARQTR
jgi:hypothetical protein